MKHFCSLMRGWLVVAVAMFLLAGPVARAQAPAWQTVIPTAVGQSFGERSQVNATATDANGNVYMVGYFFGTVQFGGLSLTSTGDYDGFVAKWSSASGSFVWAQRLGGTLSDYASTLVLSGTSLYISGSFSGTGSFGGTSLTSVGGSDAFITKLTDLGASSSFGWSQRVGSTGFDTVTSLVVSGTSVYAAGYFGGATAALGPLTLTNSNTLTSAPYDLFVAKLTDAGTSSSYVWAQSAGGTGNDVTSKLALAGTSLYLTGNFAGTATFGSITKTSAGNSDGFVAKLTDTGSGAVFNWVQTIGGTSSDYGWAVAVSGPAVYLIGDFSGTATFGTTSLATAGGFDVFVAKLLDAGPSSSFSWVQRAGGPADDRAYAAVLRGSSLCLTGFFGATALFGPTSLVAGGSSDVFVARLTDTGSTGSFAWAQKAGGPGNNMALNVEIGSGGRVYVCGSVIPPASFGSLLLAGAAGNQTGFVATLLDPVLTTRDPALQAGFQVYPNPARGTATVQLPALAGATQATLTLTDALGRTCRTHTVALPAAGLHYALEVAGLPPGLYALRVQANGAQAVQPLVVE